MRDILGQMDVAPIVREPRAMDARLYRPQAMGLQQDLLELPLEKRLHYDESRNTLFLDFEGLQVRTLEQIDDIRTVVTQRCRAIGKRVAAVVNYDAFRLDEGVADAYAAMVRELSEQCYAQVTRYTTSAFHHLMLGDVLARRGLGDEVGRGRGV